LHGRTSVRRTPDELLFLALESLAIQVAQSVQAMCEDPDLNTERQKKLVRQVSVSVHDH
jgi:hypothetical protein